MKQFFSAGVGMRLLGVCVLAAALAGCASRDVVTPKFQAAVNPTQGVPIRIEQVQDARAFQIKPPVPSTPSLMNDNISDEATRSRAFGRKRGPYGIAMGDLLVDEGNTVTTMAKTAVARAFQEAGYRVVDAKDPDYAQAAPVNVRIDKLWVWMEMSVASWNMKSNYELVLTGPVPALQQGLMVSKQVALGRVVFTTDEKWIRVFDRTLTDMSSTLKKTLVNAKP